MRDFRSQIWGRISDLEKVGKKEARVYGGRRRRGLYKELKLGELRLTLDQNFIYFLTAFILLNPENIFPI